MSQDASGDVSQDMSQNASGYMKNQKSTDKLSSFDSLIQEDKDLSDTYLAVQHNFQARYIGLWTHKAVDFKV